MMMTRWRLDQLKEFNYLQKNRKILSHRINISTKPNDYDFFLQRNLNSKSDRLIDGGHTLIPLEPHFFIDLESLFSGKKNIKTFTDY